MPLYVIGTRKISRDVSYAEGTERLVRRSQTDASSVPSHSKNAERTRQATVLRK